MSVHSFSLVPAAYVLLLRQAPGRASDPAPATAAIALAGTSRPRPDVPAPGVSTVPAPLAGTVPPGTAAPRSPGSSAAGTEVLLQLRRNTGYMDGYWATGAAGHVESGESVLQAACREAREEVGVVLAPEDLSPLTAMHRSNDVGGAAVEQRVDFFFRPHLAGDPHRPGAREGRRARLVLPHRPARPRPGARARGPDLAGQGARRRGGGPGNHHLRLHPGPGRRPLRGGPALSVRSALGRVGASGGPDPRPTGAAETRKDPGDGGAWPPPTPQEELFRDLAGRTPGFVAI